METRLVGKTFSRRFRIEEVIGHGGMAVVYRAYDLRTRQTVALKVMREEHETDAEFRASFHREEDVCRKLNHPNIINMVKCGDSGGVEYIAMEYVDGKTLKQTIAEKGKLDQETAVRYCLQILAALQHAHQRGIVHRDVKPQNIMLTKEGQLKIGDFGIARIEDGETLTSEGSVLGSVHYFSPEQAKGMKATAASDLYSVGIILYEMLTGHVPFDGETSVSIAMMHLMETPKPVSEQAEVCPALEMIIAHAMEKHPEDRYQSAENMIRDIRRALRHPDGQFMIQQYGNRKTAAEQRNDHKKKEQRMHRILVCVAAVFVVLILAAAYWLFESLFIITRVPDLSSLDSPTAQRMVESSGLIPDIVYEYSDVAEGYVVSQTPDSGAQARKNDPVQIVISKGTGLITVPRLTSLTQEEAEDGIAGAGLVLGTVEKVPSELAEGTVISQVPEAGESVEPGIAVNMTISGGQVIVPELEGNRLEEAELMLSDVQMSAGEITYQSVDSAKLDGIVLGQSIEKFEQVLPGCTIDMTVGKYDQRKYTAQVLLNIDVPEEGVGVRVTLVEQDGKESDMYSAKLTQPGQQQISVLLKSEVQDVMTWRLYLDGAFRSESTAVLK